MRLEDLDKILDSYVSRFQEMDDLMTNDEAAKWRAVSHFQKVWKQRLPFAEKWTRATSEAGSLLDPYGRRSLEGLQFLLRYPDGAVFAEQCIGWICQEDDGNLFARQQRLREAAAQLQGEIEHKRRAYRSFPFGGENALACLTLARPADNYFFRKEEADFFAACVSYPFDFSGGVSLSEYYDMCDQIREHLQSRTDIQRLIHLRCIKNGVEDLADEDHLLVYDIIHCNYAYGLMPGRKPGRVSRTETARRIRENEEREELGRRIMMMQVKLNHLEQAASVNPLQEGTGVIHKAYGLGSVTVCTATSITVQFGDAEKKFRFPDAFDKGFLTMTDTDSMDACASAVRQRAERKYLENELAQMQQKMKSLMA